jgi:hypothetical protein
VNGQNRICVPVIAENHDGEVFPARPTKPHSFPMGSKHAGCLAAMRRRAEFRPLELINICSVSRSG